MDASRRSDSSEPGRRTGENLGRRLAWTQAGARIRVSLEGERVRIWAGGSHGRKPAPGFEPGTPSLRVKCSGQLSYAGAAVQFRRRRRARGEPVAHTPDRQDQLGLLWVALDFLPEVRDVDIAGA